MPEMGLYVWWSYRSETKEAVISDFPLSANKVSNGRPPIKLNSVTVGLKKMLPQAPRMLARLLVSIRVCVDRS